MSLTLKQRKEAIRLYYQHVPKSEICRRLGCSRPTLDLWLARYDPDAVESSLQNQRPGPRQPRSSWSRAIHAQVLRMRRQRTNRQHAPYALAGAAAIHYELRALDSREVPPIRTIHRWLHAAGLIPSPAPPPRPRPAKPIPLPVPRRLNTVQQLDLKGPLYLRGSGHKYYLAVLRDRYSHRCALAALPDRQAQPIADFVRHAWQWLGRPTFLQLDNALEFRGSNRYPRSFGRLVLLAADVGVEVVFNPPNEPWRNGGVERFNGFLGERLLAREFANYAQMRRETQHCQDTCNQTHRVVGLAGQTPDECAAGQRLRLLAANYRPPWERSARRLCGFVSFVRLVRKSGRITLGAGDRFMVGRRFAHSYVRARVDLSKQRLQILRAGHVLRTYDYSRATVGAWADGKRKKPARAQATKAKCKANSGTSKH